MSDSETKEKLPAPGHDLFFIVDEKGTCVAFFDPHPDKQSQDPWQGRHYQNIFPADLSEKLKEILQKLQTGNQEKLHLDCNTPGNEGHNLLRIIASKTNLEQGQYFLLCLSAHTSEKDLQHRAQRWKVALESTGDGIWDWNASSNEVFFSAEWKKMLGYSADEIGNTLTEWDSRVHPEDKARCYEDLQKHFSGESSFYQNEHRMLCKDGSYKWILDRGKVIEWDEIGKPLRVIGTHTDISERRKVEEALLLSEQKYRHIFENVQDVYYQTDTQGIVTEISPSIERYSGYLRSEIIGQPVEMFYYYPEDRQMLSKLLQTTGSVNDFEVRLKTKDGRLVYTSVNAHIVQSRNGKPKGTEGSMRDVTDRKTAEELLKENEKKLTLFISQAPTAIAMLDTHMNYLAASKKWIDDYNIQEPEIAGCNHYELFPEIGDEWKAIHQHCLQGHAEKREEELFVRGDGCEQWLKWEVRPWFDLEGKIGGLLMFTENINEQKKRAQEIQQLNMELKAMNQQKDMLFSIIAHDLRGPFASCKMFFDNIMEDYPDMSKEDVLEYLKMLQKSSGNVFQLLEDLLLWSRNQFGRLSFDPVTIYLHELFDKVGRQLYQQAQDKNISFQPDINPHLTVMADANMLETILRNLLSNAVKFSYPGNPVFITAVKEEGEIKIAVRDQGTGMSEELCQRIFEKSSYHVRHGTGGERGSGLGLGLCRDFVEKHGGRIWAESEPEKGSTFIFTLPIA